jgi:excisionase family DNA binding protein
VANYHKKKSASVVPAVTIPKTESISPRGLRVAEVSSYTGATVCAVRAAIRDGALPALLLGKRHVVLREDADAWLSSLRAAVR